VKYNTKKRAGRGFTLEELKVRFFRFFAFSPVSLFLPAFAI